MKQTFFLLGLLILILFSCNPGVKNEFPYEFVNSKTEKVGNNVNKMDLYAYSKDMNIDSLKLFCKIRKDDFNEGMFYYLVFFDSKENAIFPSTPFTSAYGIEEEPQKHIKAFYTFNLLNGYSKLDYYEGNKWESKANSIDIN